MGAERKVSGPPIGASAAEAAVALVPKAAMVLKNEDHKKKEEPIARSDACKGGSSSKKRTTRGNYIWTPVTTGDKVVLKPKPAHIKVKAKLTPGPNASSDEGRDLDELDESHQTQKNIRNNEFTYNIFVSIKKELKAYGGTKTLSFEATLDKICMLARFPFTIGPGDWLVTRPRSLNERKPPPKCREMLWSHLEPRVQKEDEKGEDVWKKDLVFDCHFTI